MQRRSLAFIGIAAVAVGFAQIPVAQAQQVVPTLPELVNFEVTGTDDCKLDVEIVNPTNAIYRMDYLLPGQVLESVNGSYPRGTEGPIAEPAVGPDAQWPTVPFTTYPDDPKVTQATIDIGEQLQGVQDDEVTIMVRIRRGPDFLYIHWVARDFNPYTLSGCASDGGDGDGDTGSLGSLTNGPLGSLFGS